MSDLPDAPRIWTTEDELKTYISPPATANNSSNHHYIKSLYLVGVQSKVRRNINRVVFLLLFIILVLLIGIIVLSCYLSFPEKICYSGYCMRTAVMLQQNMDMSQNPCEDFFKFTCGNFEKEHPRADYESSNDWFTENQAKLLKELQKKLLQKPANGTNNTEPFPVTQARLFYTSCIDMDAMTKLEYKVLFKYLQEYNLPKIPMMINDPLSENFKFDWIKSVVRIKKSYGVDKFIGYDIFNDPKNRSVKFGALGSPTQENDLPIYENKVVKQLSKLKRKWSLTVNDKEVDGENVSEETEKALTAYAKYMKTVFGVLLKSVEPDIDVEKNDARITDAVKAALDISRKLYKLVEVSENASKADPDSEILYLKVHEFQNTTDNYIAPLDYPVFSKYLMLLFEDIPEAQFDINNDVFLTSEADLLYLKMLMKLIAETPPMHLEMFLWFSVVEDLILYTTTAMRELYYQYLKMITTLEGSSTRSSYCTRSVNKMMGMAVSYLIVEEEFPDKTKPKVETMLMNIKRAFNNLVRQTEWMDWSTKKSTLEKSDRMINFIGFPEWILNGTEMEHYYKGIKIDAGSYLENVIGLLRWKFMETLINLRKTDKKDWATSPTNVNAFHTFQSNAITIPLAILQYPFYHLGLESLNYGSIGTILGHERTHGFDDVGRQFDKDGNKLQWWSNETITHYLNKTECFKNQYSDFYIPEVSDHVNGEITLGENIADNGGLREAFYAYKYYVETFGKEPKLAGFEQYSAEQLFFISFGNLWCETMTISALRASLEDSHCPGRIRLLGSLMNSREFHQAFNCKKGQKMYQVEEKQCVIW